MKYKILGYRFCSGKFDNGDTWENLKLYCVTDEPAKGLVGQMVDIVKAPADFDVSGIVIGKIYEFSFNKYGKLVCAQEVKAS